MSKTGILWMWGICVECIGLLLISCCGFIHCELKAVPVLGTRASQSSTHPHTLYLAADKAVDDTLSTYSHTSVNDPHPWWQIDLGTNYYLGQVTVTLRQDCCSGRYRFTGAVVQAGLSSTYAENQPCGPPAARAQALPGTVHVFACDPPRMARYVSVDIDLANPAITEAILQLAEVEVYEYTLGERATNQATVDPKNFMRLHQTGYLGNHPLATEAARSLPLCAVFCLIRPGCVSFDYAPDYEECHLHSINSSYAQIIPDKAFSIYLILN